MRSIGNGSAGRDGGAERNGTAAGIESPAPPVASNGPRPSRGRRAVKIALWALLASIASGVLAVVLVIDHYSRGLPEVEQLKSNYAPPEVTRIYARDGTLLANVFTERRTVIAFDEVPDHAKLAFLAAEDAGFYEHEGLDYFGMLRALARNLRAGSTRQGGSTITQQVVKNVLLDPERTYRRKVRETILARRLEQSLSKDEILGLYLNHIYLGHGRYGIEEASRYYFGKKAAAIDLAEAALLAGIVAAPERFSPRNHPEKGLERRRYVLGQMVAKGFLTRELEARVEGEPLRLAPEVEADSELSPEMVAQAKKMLARVAGDTATRGGFEVYTTIEPKLQAEARAAVRKNLDQYLERHELLPPYTAKKRKLWGKVFEGTPLPNRVYVGEVVSTDDRLGTVDVRVGEVVGRVFLGRESRYNPKGLPPSRFSAPGAALRVSMPPRIEPGEKPPLRLEIGPQSALVVIDVRSREVVALVGSYEALAGGLDRATQSRRQPGSAFKPFVYSYALHSRRYSPASLIELPVKRPKEGEPTTRTITVRDALAKSDNEAAIRLFKEVGPANVVGWAHAVGIESKLEPDESLALGAYEVTPLEIANAYATFAAGGEYAPPIMVTRALSHGRTPLDLPPEPPKRRVMQPDEAYLITSLLRSVVEYGTGQRARALNRPVVGKTGTTNDAKDAWFVGYTMDRVAAVWVGYDDALPLGSSESGAKTALPAFVDFMKAAHQGTPVTDFTRPNSIVVTRVDPASGKLAPDDYDGSRDEEFLEGTEPEQMVTIDAGAAPPPFEDSTPAVADEPEPADDPPSLLDEAPPF